MTTPSVSLLSLFKVHRTRQDLVLHRGVWDMATEQLETKKFN